MIREAMKGDEALIEAYLAKHFATSMFMRGNLRDFGIGNTEAPYGMRYFIRESGGIGGVGNGGAVMLQASGDLAELVAHMRGALPSGFKPSVTTGAPEMVAAIIAGFGMADAPTKMNDIEPLFLLGRADLKRQDMQGFSLRPSTMDDLPLLAEWNHAYHLEVLGGVDSQESRDETYAAAKQTIKHGRQRLLLKDGEIVAQTNFNAYVPDAVQVGGVYTPPCRRGHGFARRAVAAHLDEAFAAGVEKAILVSASDTASKAYRAVGFKEIGAYQIVLFGGDA
ncbi:MAG TPA: N-acetyltransferase [Rhodobacteraceae bacterium]|nr:N-acetyltransferase [Paracoccaceae bacterium]